MLHYIIANNEMTKFYNSGELAGYRYVSEKYPTIYADKEEAQRDFNMIPQDMIELGNLEVQPVKIVRQSF